MEEETLDIIIPQGDTDTYDISIYDENDVAQNLIGYVFLVTCKKNFNDPNEEALFNKEYILPTSGTITKFSITFDSSDTGHPMDTYEWDIRIITPSNEVTTATGYFTIGKTIGRQNAQ